MPSPLVYRVLGSAVAELMRGDLYSVPRQNVSGSFAVLELQQGMPHRGRGAYMIAAIQNRGRQPFICLLVCAFTTGNLAAVIFSIFTLARLAAWVFTGRATGLPGYLPVSLQKAMPKPHVGDPL